MNFGVIAVTLSLELSIALACNASDTTASERQWAPYTRLAQASPDAAGATTNNLQGIGLTASHKRIIYDNIASEQAQTVSGDLRLAVGSTIPDSLILNSMPIAVKDQIGLLLRDFKFVKVTGDNILIVDPASRKIVDIITQQEAELFCKKRRTKRKAASGADLTRAIRAYRALPPCAARGDIPPTHRLVSCLAARSQC